MRATWWPTHRAAEAGLHQELAQRHERSRRGRADPAIHESCHETAAEPSGRAAVRRGRRRHAEPSLQHIAGERPGRLDAEGSRALCKQSPVEAGIPAHEELEIVEPEKPVEAV